MSDFLTRLAARQLGQIATIEPRVAPLYAAANAAGNRSFAEGTEYDPVPHPQEAAVIRERTPLQTPEPLTRQPLVEGHASRDPVRKITAQAFTAEVSAARPARSSAAQMPVDFSQRREPDKAESLLQETTLLVPAARSASFAPVSLVKPSHFEFAQRRNEFASPVALGSEEDRRREQAQRDEEAPVHVTIGRIEVTAMTAPTPPKRAPARTPTMSLDDYLARRQRRDR
jgi:hypothetical protein